MKREGRQRGMVRTYPILSSPRPKPRNLNELSSPPTAGLFTKVQTKPTNHSKFTGKCGRPKCRDCHLHPAVKSKEKVKGAQKMRSAGDVTSSHRLITWRVADVAAAPGLKLKGFSATGVLDYLGSSDEEYVDRGRDGYEEFDDDRDNVDVDVDDGCCYDDDRDDMSSRVVEIQEVDGGHVDDDDDHMSFCEVGFVWEAVDEGDESWCLVEEI